MKKLIVVLLVTVCIAAAVQAQSKLEKNFAELANDIFENLQSYYPVLATEKGIHTYDYKLTDYSSKAVNGEIKKLRGFEKRLLQYKGTNLSPSSKLNYRLLKSEVDIALHDLHSQKWYKKNPYLYVSEAVNGLYLILCSQYAPLEERAQNIVARMKVTPDLFWQAKRNLDKPAPVYIRLAKGTLVEGITFFETVRDDLKEQVPELAAEIEMTSEKAIAAMKDFQAYLGEITPGDVNAFAMGKDHFDYRLQNQYFLDYDSDSLMVIGEYLFAQADSAYQAYLAYLDSVKVKNDSVFVVDCIGKDHLLDYYNWEVEQTRVFLQENDIVTVPDDIGECVVLETPPIMQNVISSIAYQPPGVYSPDQTGCFFVRPVPDTLDQGQREAYYRYIQRRGFKGSVVHEAYPGHHLQFQIAAQLPDSIRKWFDNMLFVEGWALYCEQMMYDQGFYKSDPGRYLNILRGIRFRAARIIADIKLHARKEAVDDVVTWMAEKLDADTSVVRAEIDWYVLKPTIPMTYLIGKQEIMALRDAVIREAGEAFSLKAFHDRLLSEGAVPPTLLWEYWGVKK